jgi:hypothetical protein
VVVPNTRSTEAACYTDGGTFWLGRKADYRRRGAAPVKLMHLGNMQPLGSVLTRPKVEIAVVSIQYSRQTLPKQNLLDMPIQTFTIME